MIEKQPTLRLPSKEAQTSLRVERLMILAGAWQNYEMPATEPHAIGSRQEGTFKPLQKALAGATASRETVVRILILPRQDHVTNALKGNHGSGLAIIPREGRTADCSPCPRSPDAPQRALIESVREIFGEPPQPKAP